MKNVSILKGFLNDCQKDCEETEIGSYLNEHDYERTLIYARPHTCA